MTCIIGFAEGGKAWIGGDSAGVAGYSLQNRADEKVFRSGPFIMGFTTSFRMGQLLRYNLTHPEHPAKMNDMAFMVQRFVPAVRSTFKDHGFAEIDKGRETGGLFLVGYRGSIYEIGSDFQVGRSRDNLHSVGCGYEIALGSMHALAKMPARNRILKSLAIVEKLNAGVRGPFVVKQL